MYSFDKSYIRLSQKIDQDLHLVLLGLILKGCVDDKLYIKTVSQYHNTPGSYELNLA